MNNNSKKNILNKKNILIVLLVLLVLFILYFVLFNNSNNKMVSCTMTIDDNNYAKMDIEIDAYYTNKVNMVEGKINYNIIDSNLKTKIDEIEKALKNSYEKFSKSDSIVMNISRSDDIIIIEYKIDYASLKGQNIDFLNLGEENLDDDFSIKKLKEQVNKAGGVCIEE